MKRAEIYERIKADAQFHKECEAAQRKAEKVAERQREKLRVAEEKEMIRHRKVMDEIARKQRAIFRDVYSPIYDPLEEAAFARAEERLFTLNN
ncbi:hypothetical protein O9X81_00045 [Agrobacterium salinitolerans]|uniref:hypothetical protein n=1 Tax=Agrobacterium salinitolerans TaxID=1183413 RepID=UPI0022B831DD|nr:hypothetical protein [Agrobacterium salinitolerans]MCZ7854998.1 hypothetical protein [Agrobacterium salinitolerans]